MKLKPSIKIVLTVENKTHRISLIPQPFKGRYWVRYNGKISKNMEPCTISKALEKTRKFIVKAENERIKRES